MPAKKQRSHPIRDVLESISPPPSTTAPASGLRVTDEMKQILAKPGYISVEMGGQKLRTLYLDKSVGFTDSELSHFGQACFFGSIHDIIQRCRRLHQAFQMNQAPDLSATETEFKFGYATLVIFGSQRVRSLAMQPNHLETLKFLISRELPLDIPDICGHTALHHSVFNDALVRKGELLRVLLESGADVNRQNRYGGTPLCSAMMRNDIVGVELFMEFGADLDIKDVDGVTPRTFFPSTGPQVTATIQRWIGKRKGEIAPRTEKRCDACGDNQKSLKNCGKCQVARYCSVECQRKHWPTHKKTCQPFGPSNTATLKPHYEGVASLIPTSNITRKVSGIPTAAIPESHFRPSNVPKGLEKETKSIIIKVQAPMHQGAAPLLIYTKKRDFVSKVVKAKGVGGVKAYFAAELKSKDELVVKISEVLAEQPF
ncbi:hypothetical protein BDQ12DRAFT_713611 [Crucibulum laeve]|uniref:MYND-type domain-containing protein n=1 Tax=Crucibulum laeve TaxID=68775 RepID=A0A5C3LWQ0_9AGAR|nr:hypothetical protein BDQ12DRAFT_713611 [Crucibulum laeve]